MDISMVVRKSRVFLKDLVPQDIFRIFTYNKK